MTDIMVVTTPPPAKEFGVSWSQGRSALAALREAGGEGIGAAIYSSGRSDDTIFTGQATPSIPGRSRVCSTCSPESNVPALATSATSKLLAASRDGPKFKRIRCQRPDPEYWHDFSAPIVPMMQLAPC